MAFLVEDEREVGGVGVHIEDEESAKQVLSELDGSRYQVADVTTKEKKRNPVPPFITSKLQQEASRKLRFSAKKTMQMAQRLYEGVELGEEGVEPLVECAVLRQQ